MLISILKYKIILSKNILTVKIIDSRTLSFYVGARGLCSTIYIDRRYLNGLRNVELNSVESNSIDTRSNRLQYFDTST